MGRGGCQGAARLKAGAIVCLLLLSNPSSALYVPGPGKDSLTKAAVRCHTLTLDNTAQQHIRCMIAAALYSESLQSHPKQCLRVHISVEKAFLGAA